MKPLQTQRTALVTGATGYVGSCLVRHLAAAGWDVQIIVRPGSRLGPAVSYLPAASVHGHDGTTDEMLRIMERVRPTVVFHLASLFLAQHGPQDIEPLVRSNVLLGTQLVEAMAKNGVRYLVNTGTSWQHYGNAPYDPVCLYAATKQAYEAIIRYYQETTLLSVITLKLFDTYGPGDPRPKLFSVLRKAAAEQQPLAMSPGEQLLDLVYIDDVTRAFLLSADRLLSGVAGKSEEYAVSSGATVTLKQLAEIYGRVTGKKLLIQWGGRPYRPREVMVPWNTGKQLPGWIPATTLEEGIRRMESSSA